MNTHASRFGGLRNRLLVVLIGVVTTCALLAHAPSAEAVRPGAGHVDPRAGSWTHLAPTYSILDITRAKALGSKKQSLAKVQISYDPDALGWTLPNQAIRLAFGRMEAGERCHFHMPMPLMIEMDFPDGAYKVFSGKSYAAPNGRAEVKVSKVSRNTWEYTVKSSKLAGSGINCLWVAVGYANDWEWFVNSGAFEGRLYLR